MTSSPETWNNKPKPFVEGVALQYKATFSPAEFVRLQAGLVPEQMEDKWLVYFEDPYLFFHRSWTGRPVYRLKLVPTPSGVEVEEALWASEFARDPDADRPYEARLLDFLVSNLLLGHAKLFPRPEGVKEEALGAFQHHVSGTGYQESVIPAKRVWWRFW